MDVTIQDDRLRDIQREYFDFLDDSTDQDLYASKVRELIQQKESRLTVNVNDLRRKLPVRCRRLLDNSFEEIICLEKALNEFVKHVDPAFASLSGNVFVGFEGSFGTNHVTPRTLSARFLGRLVCVEGIVTKCSLIRPKMVKSVHYCPETRKTMERTYTDMTSLDAFPSSAAYPTKDEDGNVLETEFGLSTFKDHQSVTIQEMPEKAPAGQLPRSVEIVCDNDLVDGCKPGDRVLAIGVYRCLPNKQGGFTSGVFRAIMLCNNIKTLSKEVQVTFTHEDMAKIRKFAKQKIDIFEELSNSLAPTIHGHKYVKQALLCMLLGGVEKTLENGTRLRGDINVLLVGDPSVAKSQMLRYVLNTAPRAIPTTGRGSSGVGLTAAVTTDAETGERRLEAGAMVLADRGIVCIDEFDKMSDIDRTAIHEVMEQGRVSIAKVGIHAQLNARCSVLAAANPVYGRYDQYQTPMHNIGLQDSLLSRFDLLFILLDEMEPEQDRAIADHVLRIHRYRPAGQQDGEVLPFGSGADALTTEDTSKEGNEDEDTQIYEKHDNLLHGQRDKGRRFVSIGFMRKYVNFAKSITPVLTKDARDMISEEYAKLRAEDAYNQDTQNARTQPVTVRTLETLIRLSTAHARSRLSKNVQAQDATAAIELIEYAFFKKVLSRPRRKPGANDSDDSGVEEEGEDVSAQQPRKRSHQETGGDAEEAAAAAPQDKKRREARPGEEAFEFEDQTSVVPTPKAKKTKEVTKEKAPAFDAARFDQFKKSVSGVFSSKRLQEIALPALLTCVTETWATGIAVDKPEAMAFLDRMQEANQVMVTDEVVYLI